MLRAARGPWSHSQRHILMSRQQRRGGVHIKGGRRPIRRRRKVPLRGPVVVSRLSSCTQRPAVNLELRSPGFEGIRGAQSKGGRDSHVGHKGAKREVLWARSFFEPERPFEPCPTSLARQLRSASQGSKASLELRYPIAEYLRHASVFNDAR